MLRSPYPKRKVGRRVGTGRARERPSVDDGNRMRSKRPPPPPKRGKKSIKNSNRRVPDGRNAKTGANAPRTMPSAGAAPRTPRSCRQRFNAGVADGRGGSVTTEGYLTFAVRAHRSHGYDGTPGCPDGFSPRFSYTTAAAVTQLRRFIIISYRRHPFRPYPRQK